jgi:putative hydroxymethylpyrimidine transport system substrate-binding protein
LLAAVFLLLTGACSQKPTPSSADRELRVRLDWTPWVPHAAFYAAENQGYYRDEGLKVKLYVPPDPDATIKLVASRQDDVGISYMTETVFARQQGFKVKSIGAVIPHPLNCIMTLRKSGIDKPEKLKGKIIGTSGAPSDSAFLDWILAQKGLKKGDYKVLNIGFSLAEALKSGNVDAIIGAYWPWEGVKLEQDGYPVYVLKLQDLKVPDYYELVLVAREDTNSDVLRKFMRATVKGYNFVLQRPSEAVSILRKVSPDLSEAFLTAAMKEMTSEMQFPSRIFYQDPRIWQSMVTFMRTTGLLDKDVTAESAFTNDFLPNE